MAAGGVGCGFAHDRRFRVAQAEQQAHRILVAALRRCRDGREPIELGRGGVLKHDRGARLRQCVLDGRDRFPWRSPRSIAGSEFGIAGRERAGGRLRADSAASGDIRVRRA